MPGTLSKEERSDYRWIGFGLYTIAEAARLTSISVGRVRRWMKGYAFRRQKETRISTPLLHGRFVSVELGETALTFADLIELRCVYAFLEAG
jgi:hypothetical protein